jgi:Rab9 effector protein with kelch motifs
MMYLITILSLILLNSCDYLNDSQDLSTVKSETNSMNSWIELDNISYKPNGREFHRMSFIDTNKLLMFGGHDKDYLSDTWIFDLSSNTWDKVISNNHPSKRRLHGQAYIGNKKVLLFGGHDESTVFSDTWEFDLDSSTWTNLNITGNVPIKRSSSSMSYLGDDKVLLFGGTSNGKCYDETWIFDLSENIWTEVEATTKPSGRVFHESSFIAQNRVLLFGGLQCNETDLGDTWVFNGTTNKWNQINNLSSLPDARRYHGLEYIGDNKVILYAGFDGKNFNDTWEFDLSSNSWLLISNSSNIRASHAHGMAYIGNGTLILFAGNKSLQKGNNLSDIFKYSTSIIFDDMN